MSEVNSFIINATNVHVTINGHWIKDAVAIHVQEQSSHRMAYGYMDSDARRPIMGHKVVVGTIGIHKRMVQEFFRYVDEPNAVNRDIRHEAAEKLRSMLQQFDNVEQILAYMATQDLSSSEFDALVTAFEKNQRGEPFTPHDLAAAPDTADLIGEDGFKAAIKKVTYHETKRRSYYGAEIYVHYGEALDESMCEVIRGVVFNNKANSNLENSAGVSANPLLEYHSFIAARVDEEPVTGNQATIGRA